MTDQKHSPATPVLVAADESVCAAVQAFDLAVDLDLPRDFGRPSGGFAQWVDRHGCRESRDGPWMARFGVPTERDRSEGTRAQRRPYVGVRPFCLLLWLFDKSEPP